jgi:hypothetical protein
MEDPATAACHEQDGSLGPDARLRTLMGQIDIPQAMGPASSGILACGES